MEGARIALARVELFPFRVGCGVNSKRDPVAVKVRPIKRVTSQELLHARQLPRAVAPEGGAHRWVSHSVDKRLGVVVVRVLPGVVEPAAGFAKDGQLNWPAADTPPGVDGVCEAAAWQQQIAPLLRHGVYYRLRPCRSVGLRGRKHRFGR
jgi:hypothetical protein